MLKEKVPSATGKDARYAGGLAKPAEAVDSLKTQLEQALQVRDGDMLDSLLSDEEVLTSTTKDLPGEILEQLVATLCDRLRSDPGKSRDAVRWLKHTLRGNIYLVASSPSIKEALTGIGSVLTERGQMLHNVVKIKGKVEHLVESRRQAREAARAAILLKNTAPLVVIKGGVVQTADTEQPQDMDEEDPEGEQQLGLEGIDDEVDDEIEDEDLEENMYQEAYENEEIGEQVDDELDDDEDEEGDDDDVEEQLERAKLKAKLKSRMKNGKRN